MILALPLIVIIGGLAWWFAVRSRRSYVCPSCGQAVTVEHMTASSCNVCGAPLQEVQK